MALFKAVKKPAIRQTSSADLKSSSLRPRYTPKAAPCTVDCPIGCDIRGALTTIADAEADGRTVEQAFELAWQRITARNPFPSVCGRICSHPCESNCHRQLKEGAVAIQASERFLGDYAIAHRLGFARAKQLPGAVAVIGAGPAGLSAAYHLARRGYKVTVREGSGQAGGVMRSAVPDEILDAEIQRILDIGAELKCGCGELAKESLGAEYSAVIETASLDAAEASGVAAAIAAGLAAAQDADARMRGAAPAAQTALGTASAQRMHPEWYKEQPRFNGEGELTADGMVSEARRCMSCGMCMGCGNCWSYCTKGGFEKLPTSRRYRLTLERCNGCGKCSDGCPSGYIDMK